LVVWPGRRLRLGRETASVGGCARGLGWAFGGVSPGLPSALCCFA
jgi:hypothetical protein